MLPSCVNSEDLTEVVYLPDTAMNQADQQEVRRIIAEGRKGFPLWAKESLGFAIVMAGAAFIVSSYIPDKITSQTSAMATDIGTLKESVGTLKTDVGDIKKDIKDVLVKALDRAIQGTSLPSGKPQKRGALEHGNAILEVANNLGLQLDNSVRYGQDALNIAASNPAFSEVAWRGANLSLQQRALLNAAFVPSRSVAHDLPIQTAWSLPGPVLGKTTPLGALLPGEEGAVSDKLEEQVPPGTPHIQVHIHNKVTPEYLLVEHADALIDEFQLKRLIYKNSRISYRGGRVQIKMVYFVNCRFDVSATKEGERFGRALLESVPMSFNSSGE